MPPGKPRSHDYARNALYRQRQTVRKWGLFALVVALIIGAIVAPNTTLLAFVALVVFGLFGTAVAWGLRLIDRLLAPPPRD